MNDFSQSFHDQEYHQIDIYQFKFCSHWYFIRKFRILHASVTFCKISFDQALYMAVFLNIPIPDSFTPTLSDDPRSEKIH